jgi:hypothetical protein
MYINVPSGYRQHPACDTEHFYEIYEYNCAAMLWNLDVRNTLEFFDVIPKSLELLQPHFPVVQCGIRIHAEQCHWPCGKSVHLKTKQIYAPSNGAVRVVCFSHFRCNWLKVMTFWVLSVFHFLSIYSHVQQSLTSVSMPEAPQLAILPVRSLWLMCFISLCDGFWTGRMRQFSSVWKKKFVIVVRCTDRCRIM